jgi:hypothetical protein
MEALQKAVDRSVITAAPKRQRSAISNGQRTFITNESDGRSAWTRRWKDLTNLHLDDLGLDDPSAAQVALAKRAATIECELERQEGIISAGGTVDIEAFGRLTSTLRRTLESLGIKRVMKELTPADKLRSHAIRSAKGGTP